MTLFAMTLKGYEVLSELIERFPGLVGTVVGARDPNVGEDHYETIQALCDDHSVRFFDRGEHGAVETAFAMAVSWRWLIPIEPDRLVILHDSLLPQYRGFNPLVSCLINGESELGVSAVMGHEEFDRGALITQSSVEVSYPLKIADAIALLISVYRGLAREIGSTLAAGEQLTAEPQDEALATYSLWRDEYDYRIDWTSSSDQLRRFIDAVGHPYRRAATMVNGRLARVVEVEVVPDVSIENRDPGKVIFRRNGCPVVVCGKGLLAVSELIDDTTGEALLPLGKFRTRFS